MKRRQIKIRRIPGTRTWPADVPLDPRDRSILRAKQIRRSEERP